MNPMSLFSNPILHGDPFTSVMVLSWFKPRRFNFVDSISFTLPLGPSDNARTTVFSWIARRPGMPCSKWKARGLIKLTERARKYEKAVRVLMPEKIIVAENEFYVMAYVAQFPDRRRRDPGNLRKSIEDALFKDDERVYTWVMPPKIAKDDPCVEVTLWRFETPPQS